MSREKAPHPLGKALLIFVLVASFLVYEMAMQVSPGVMTEQLIRDLHLNASSLGLMSGLYFYTYTAMQVPAGLLFDRFFVRGVILLPLIICAFGAYLFSIADSFTDGTIARMFMGVGGSFAFIAVLVVAGDIFPRRHFALFAGLAQMLGAFGAMGGELPLIPIINHYGWRATMSGIAWIGFALAVLIWLFVRYNRTEDEEIEVQAPSAWQSVTTILRLPQSWPIAIYACVLWAPMSAFASLWGVPCLVATHHLTHAQAAAVISMMWIGLAFGSPLLGWWSDRIGQRKMPLVLSAAIGLVSMVIILAVPTLPFVETAFFAMLAGAACSGQVLSFAVARENHEVVNHGAAIAFNNMAVVISGAFFQPLMGKLIQMHWQGAMANGIPLYSGADYFSGAVLIPACFALGVLVSQLGIKETHCQDQSQSHLNIATA